MRERRTLLLMITAPLLVLFIMGAIFSGSTSLEGKGAIGMCDLDQSATSQLFADGIRNSSRVVDYGSGGECAMALEMDVRQGRLAAGFVLPYGYEEGLAQGKTQNITLVLDNSKFQVSPSLEAFVKAAVQETDQKIGMQFIMTVWERLDAADAKLGKLLPEINATREKAIEMKARLQGTSDSLDSLDISNVREQIFLANRTVDGTVDALSQAEANLTKIQSNFEDYDITLNQTQSDLEGINSTLANASDYIAGAKAGMNCSEPIFMPTCISLNSVEAQLNGTQELLGARLGKVIKAREDLSEANATIQEFKAGIAQAKNGSVDARQRLSGLSDFVQELEQNRNGALATIADAKQSLDEIIGRTYDLADIISSSRAQIREITSQRPEFVISPMMVESVYIFGQKPFFEFMLPSLLPLILMFVALFLSSTSLVREKYSGTLMRVYTSQVDRFEYVAVKVLSYTIVLMPEAILLALVASVFYGAFPLEDLGTWFFVMQSLALLTLTFVSLGVLIAIYSESEATAFLASLVVGLPMLFLSGLLFPFEFMPPLVAITGILSPLSQAVLSMQAAILYKSLETVGSLSLLGYAGIISLVAALSMKK